jgi:hypothetical protein
MFVSDERNVVSGEYMPGERGASAEFARGSHRVLLSFAFWQLRLSTFRIRSEVLRLSCVLSPGVPLEPAIRWVASADAGVFMNTKLYVGNLPYETTESDLQTLFEAAGQVSTVTIVRDRATGQARGFAFVEMSDAEGARKAIAELDRHEVGGRSLSVNEAKPMAARSNGGGSGGGRQRREPRW